MTRVSAPGLRVFWGESAWSSIQSELDRLGTRRPLLIHPSSLSGPDGPASMLRHALGEPQTFPHVRAHSPLLSVRQVVAILVDHRCDAIIALGGGSAMVTARAAAVLHAEGDNLESISTHRDSAGRLVSPKLEQPKIPIIAIPTVPSTAIEKAGSAITVPGRAARFALFDPKTRAASIFLLDEALASAPSELVRDATLNTFCMSVEGLVTRRSNPIADAALLHAITLVRDNLPKLDSPDVSTEVRRDLAFAALLGGWGTDTAGGGLTAALTHTIGHHHHVHNGKVDAVLLPHVLKFIRTHAESGFARLSRVFGCEPSQVSSELSNFLADSGAPARLHDLGIRPEDFPDLAEASLLDFSASNSLRVATTADIVEILDRAW